MLVFISTVPHFHFHYCIYGITNKTNRYNSSSFVLFMRMLICFQNYIHIILLPTQGNVHWTWNHINPNLCHFADVFLFTNPLGEIGYQVMIWWYTSSYFCNTDGSWLWSTVYWWLNERLQYLQCIALEILVFFHLTKAWYFIQSGNCKDTI